MASPAEGASAGAGPPSGAVLTLASMKGLVEEAMARRAACGAVLGDRWAQGGLSTPPWVRKSRCPAGASASDAVLRALLRSAPARRPPPRPAPRSRARARPTIEQLRQRRHPPTDFEYVVREQQKARVAFGSAQERAVMPLAGLRGSASRLANLAMRTTDSLQHLGPAEYNAANLNALYDILTKKTSTRGVGPGARTALRFKEVDQHLPAPNAYQLVSLQHTASENRVPFNTTTRRRPLALSSTPGPGSYTPGVLSGRPGQPVLVLCAGGEAPARCEGCLQTLAEGVEFWSVPAKDAVLNKLPPDIVLCEACMAAARRQRPRDCRFNRWQLQAFKKSRDCSDVHRHEGTKAKIYLKDPATVEKRRRKEIYLSKYFRDHTIVNRDYMPGTEPARLTEVEQVQSGAKKDDFCCLHQAFNSFNKDQMSFGLRLPSELIYNTMKRCALDFHPSLDSSAD